MTDALQLLLEASKDPAEHNKIVLMAQALSQCYALTHQETQTISGLAFGKHEVFKLLMQQKDERKIIAYRLLFFLLQSAITCQDFISLFPVFVSELVDETLIQPAEYLKPTAHAQYSNISYPFGTFLEEQFDSYSPIPAIADAASSLLCLFCRQSVSIRREIFQTHTGQLIQFVKNASFNEVIQPFRLTNVLQIFLQMITQQTEQPILHFFINSVKLIQIIEMLCKTVFYNNALVMSNIDNFAQTKSQLVEEYCQIYNLEGQICFRSRDLYILKTIVIVLLIKLRDPEAEVEK
ncbi:Conserved_hypothetical protein [Hexamita inflata]|uniref:Uncharacterized protein n=1 Tax=Hexamita inflata TaxID=28002 RepID=A0AA86UGZ4_9EUKA|nr:Conserved hypothetical protein [Hexamita inflata]CAI9950742.1 Conserved hypothetical protein [Hexamita inflata]